MSYPPPPSGGHQPPPSYAPPGHPHPGHGPYGGHPPYAPPRQSSYAGLIVGIIALLLIGGLAALYFTRTLDKWFGRSTSVPAITSAPAQAPIATPPPVATPTSTMPVTSPLPASGATACPGVVSASDPGGAAATGDSNRLVVQGNGVSWNGTSIDPVSLRQYLDLTRTMNPQPTLVTRAEPGANPQVIGRVMTVIQQSLGCRPARF